MSTEQVTSSREADDHFRVQISMLKDDLHQALVDNRKLSETLEKSRTSIKELDALFGKQLIGMRAAVIEAEHGKGAEAGIRWIWNGLAGPGELPPDDEHDAQAYFDREIKAIDAVLDEVYASRIATLANPHRTKSCEHCNSKGEIETGNNGPIVHCPVCQLAKVQVPDDIGPAAFTYEAADGDRFTMPESCPGGVVAIHLDGNRWSIAANAPGAEQPDESEPFMYGIATADGRAHIDDFCVSSEPHHLFEEVERLNSNDEDQYRVVALYAATHSTEKQMPERIKEQAEQTEGPKPDQRILHLVTQDGQPYGSVRKCCEECGILTAGRVPEFWKSHAWTDDREEYADDEGHITCATHRKQGGVP